MNGKIERFVVKRRGAARKPGGLSNIRLVIRRSSCNDVAKEKRLTIFGVIDRSKSGLFGHTNMRPEARTRLELMLSIRDGLCKP